MFIVVLLATLLAIWLYPEISKMFGGEGISAEGAAITFGCASVLNHLFFSKFPDTGVYYAASESLGITLALAMSEQSSTIAFLLFMFIVLSGTLYAASFLRIHRLKKKGYAFAVEPETK